MQSGWRWWVAQRLEPMSKFSGRGQANGDDDDSGDSDDDNGSRHGEMLPFLPFIF